MLSPHSSTSSSPAHEQQPPSGKLGFGPGVGDGVGDGVGEGVGDGVGVGLGAAVVVSAGTG